MEKPALPRAKQQNHGLSFDCIAEGRRRVCVSGIGDIGMGLLKTKIELEGWLGRVSLVLSKIRLGLDWLHQSLSIWSSLGGVIYKLCWADPLSWAANITRNERKEIGEKGIWAGPKETKKAKRKRRLFGPKKIERRKQENFGLGQVKDENKGKMEADLEIGLV